MQTRILLAVAGLLVTGAVQAFCFSMGSGHERPYAGRMPAVGFTPGPYYGYPYSPPPATGRYPDGVPVMLPGINGNPVPPGGPDWR